MRLTRTALVWTLSAVAAAALLVTGGAVWAITAAHPTGGTTSDGPAPDPSATSVPALYTGDELEWLLLPDDQLQSLLGATDIQSNGASYLSSGESEGVHTAPEECFPLVMEDASGIIGVRGERWTQGSGVGHLTVRQFASAAQAQSWAASSSSVLDRCASFAVLSYDGATITTDTLSKVTKASGADTEVVVYDHDVTPQDQYNANALDAIVVHGNLVMTLSTPPADDLEPKKLADALMAQAGSARRRLVQELG